MSKLIKALQIFLKYGDVTHPTHCEHDTLRIYGYDSSQMSKEDISELDELGFSVDEEFDECFISFRYGSC